MPQTNSFWWCTCFLIRRTVIFNTNFALYYFIYICLCILLTAEMGKSTKPTSLRPIESKLHQLKEEKEKKKTNFNGTQSIAENAYLRVMNSIHRFYHSR